MTVMEIPDSPALQLPPENSNHASWPGVSHSIKSLGEYSHTTAELNRTLCRNMIIDIDTKLLLVFSFFCFNGVFTGGNEGRTADLGMEGFEHGRWLSHYKGRSSCLFNVKKFGARADGLTDDSKVCFLLFLSPLN